MQIFRGMLKKPDFASELQLMEDGFYHVAGVDEVGRGPLAGPVVAAAVILDRHNLPVGIDDSKRLTALQRRTLYKAIFSKALAISFSSLSARSIDRNNIRICSLEAMRRAIFSLSISPNYVLVDGIDIPSGLSCKADALIKGDQISISIAAASIVAKVLRDRIMTNAGLVYPAYQLERHVGYATATHRRIIKELGPISGLHRYSFRPIKGQFVDEANNFSS